MKKSLFLLLCFIFLVLASYLGHQVFTHTLSYKGLKQDQAQVLTYKKRLLNINEWLGKERWAGSSEADRLAGAAQKHYAVAKRSGWLFAGLLGLFLGGMWVIAKGDKNMRGLAVLLAAVCCLVVGLLTPMLEIGAFEEDLSIPIEVEGKLGFLFNLDFTAQFDGKMYFYYQSKSIVELIQLLFEAGNWFVGISILLFSIVIPLTKMAASGWLMLKPAASATGFMNTLVHKIGKWSMADVFVAAVFLAFLAFNNMQTGIQTESKTLIGLYFFFAYCVLSIGGKIND